MKLPVLKVKYLPNLYKHCKKVQALHVDYQIDVEYEQNQEILLWLKDSRELLYQFIENQFFTCCASRVFTSNQETFVVFKDNMTKKTVISFLENLLSELSSYTEQHVTYSYQLLPVILYDETKEIKFFSNKKLGDDILESDELKNANTVFHATHPPKGKYFKSWKEMPKRKVKTTKPVIEKKQETPIQEDSGYMYYI